MDAENQAKAGNSEGSSPSAHAHQQMFSPQTRPTADGSSSGGITVAPRDSEPRWGFGTGGTFSHHEADYLIL
jgi:hypothetical protein